MLLNYGKVYFAGITPALGFAKRHLSRSGITIADNPGWDTAHLLLDVPSFRPGLWPEKTLDTLLSSLPRDVTIWGGMLDRKELDTYSTVDLLTDEAYLRENAVITADCAIPIAEEAMTCPWEQAHVLLIGWGRITKALSSKIRALGADVTIASGKEGHRAEAVSQHFPVLDSADLENRTASFDLIINTAPAPVLSVKDPGKTILMDLASVNGIDGPDVIRARALPGRLAPERSGTLIAETFLRRIREGSQ